MNKKTETFKESMKLIITCCDMLENRMKRKEYGFSAETKQEFEDTLEDIKTEAHLWLDEAKQ